MEPLRAVIKFKAQLQILELPEENKLRNNKHKSPSFVREGWAVVCSIALARPIVVDVFQNISTLCRFTLRDDGIIIAMVRVTELANEKLVDFII